MSVVYDASMLVAADRNDRAAWADHRIRLELGITPIAPDQAHAVGALLGASNTSDVVDAHVAIVASVHHAVVITSDDDDFKHLSAHLPEPLLIEHV